MGISIEWDNADKAIIRVTFSGYWTWDELRDAKNRGMAMLDKAGRRVDFLVDMREMNYFPPDFGVKFRAAMEDYHPLVGIVVFVGNAISWQLLHLLTLQYGGVGYAFAYVQTMERACQIIQQARAGLPFSSDVPNLSHLN